MQSLKSSLKKFLKGADRISVLGIGSELRADDAAGILVAKGLEGSQNDKFKVFIGHTAPENLSGEIRKYMPSRLIMIDTADIGKKPGETIMFTPEDAGGISFSTHKLPIKILAQYLQKDIDCKITIIGIQPKLLDFGKPVSNEVRKSIGILSGMLKEVLS
jgi:hydrogenase 3 maturation protease